ncbi:YigZ family protein [Alicyclobacillus fastidiosus]|uniref:YigZ family protein n=1 Tax=Alicyclobacillus fastidiosus TaxID=392011 RepID=A0ABY6ZFX1_9BACL|nr:YigZ family protein [Alicyclobacillus fastidiosus]WAH41820.1 YigZ family protein [Alicyclobacillus fastidiosus]GMA63518.1 YigZ family protein [Alicyclobacillus fastidiosus]
MKFTTPESEFTLETVEKKSRFIATVVPISGVDDAEQALLDIREQHKSANHNCFAYRVGLGVPVERFSDDGEPSGTAGRPILEVIRRRTIDNVLVVVTRYFGGILLGASGLVRAYADAASQGLSAAAMLECDVMNTLQVTCDYGVYGKLEYVLGQSGIAMYEKAFSDVVSFDIVVPEVDVEDRLAALSEWTNGQATVKVLPGEYIGVTQDGSLVRGFWPTENT